MMLDYLIITRINTTILLCIIKPLTQEEGRI